MEILGNGERSGQIIAAITKQNEAAFKFAPFSKKQQALLYWWSEKSPYRDCAIVIADGAIRSGKTISMICSFMMFSQFNFTGENFIIAGKSIGSLKRNVIDPMLRILYTWGWCYKYNRSENIIEVYGNKYYLFGASTEASQDTLQGLTAAGAFADEVALFPETFLQQMIGRCSIAGRKIFLNCNPENSMHKIKTEWIDKAVEKEIAHFHFVMDDNLSLPDEIKEGYMKMYSGMFFRRFILGEWCAADGVIYDMFDEDTHVFSDEIIQKRGRRYVSIDYGTTNPTVFLDIVDTGNEIFVLREYYYDSKVKGVQKTDREYADDLTQFLGGESAIIIIDPSAASFRLEMRRKGYRVKEADNEVMAGIQMVSTLLNLKLLKVHESCTNTISEFLSYVWDEKASIHGTEKPIKQNDHAMDALRYMIYTTLKGRRFARRG